MEGYEKELECAICRNVMADPRLLACQHVFCMRCIYGSCEKGEGVKDIVVSCPYNCGMEEVQDVRGLPKCSVISNLCHNIRSERFKEKIEQLCDACGEEEGENTQDFTQCSKCSSVLCKPCTDTDPVHTYLCGSEQKFFPFYFGWGMAEKELRKVFGLSRMVTPTVTCVERLFVPTYSFRVQSQVKVCNSATQVVRVVNSIVGDPSIPENFRAKIERDSHSPDTFPQLELLYKLQESKTRQISLLTSVKNLLCNSPLTPILERNSETITDMRTWDFGLSNDCTVLIEMQLILIKQLCNPLARKIHVVSTLEGLRQLKGVKRDTQSRSDLAKQLKMVNKTESFLAKQSKQECDLFSTIDTTVQGLVKKQHSAYQNWVDTLTPISLHPMNAALKGGVDLQQGSPAVLGRFTSSGCATFTVDVPASGEYGVDLLYSCTTSGLLEITCCGEVYPVEYLPTLSWKSFRTARPVRNICLPKGKVELAITVPPRGTPPPDVAKLTLQYSPPRSEPAVSEDPPGCTNTHEELITILGFCHKLQLEILEDLDGTYGKAAAAYWGGRKEDHIRREDIINKERRDLLNMLRNVQQVRIFHRQYFYCVLAGLTTPKTTSVVHPFPVTVPRPSKKTTAESLPNLLQVLQPRIQELREEQQSSMSRDPPLHVQEQFQSVLLQTFDLLHREQILQLREGIQEAREQLMLYIQPGCVAALLEHLTPLPEGVDAYKTKGDIHDLQTIQVLWNKAFEKLKGEEEREETDKFEKLFGSPKTPDDVQLGDRMTRKIVEGLMDYTSTVIQQRRKLEVCISELSTERVEVSGVEVLLKKRDAVGVAADRLEVHLKIVEQLRKLLKMAQTTSSTAQRFQLLSQVVVALKKLQTSASKTNEVMCAIQSSLAVDETLKFEDASEEPLISWFVKQDAINHIGLLERCFTSSPLYGDVERREVEISQEDKRECRSRAFQAAQSGWVVKELLCCLSLQTDYSISEPIEVSFKQNTPSSCLSFVTHHPYYKGEYTIPTHGSPLPFLINGQTGSIYMTYPPLAVDSVLLSVPRILRSPLAWLLLNGAVIWWRCKK
eukprot:TRINITY_DN11797_c4_g1_i1.p1 TRINITY_DN11797_c4_g1~~TRINITY_DN11797_c4_g1_i1.p1  ORF type:complete len:1089 (+),score=182.85 TRINITY_DN11797_c4_g1_i1:75-3269(+)